MIKVTVRIQRSFFESLVEDLVRPHSLAAERVGFMFAKHANAGDDHQLLFPVRYMPVRDEDYIADDFVGARFGTSAIRAALQESLTTGFSCLQVHVHDQHGPTNFSGVDRTTIDQLANSLCSVAPNAPHGGVVFTRDNASARVWCAGATRKLAAARVTIVGFPLTLGPELR